MAELESILKRDELFKLREHYGKVVIDELGFCFNYLNFYVGLLSALLVATVTALFQFDLTLRLGFILLLGPVLIVFLALLGYKTFSVFYRRFTEAWVTSLNIDAMLGMREEVEREPGVKAPLFTSKYTHSFVAEFERPPVRELMETAAKEKWPAEDLLVQVVKIGDTLRFARWTFAGFIVAAGIAGLVILILLLGGHPLSVNV